MSDPPVRVTLTGVEGAFGGTLTLRFQGFTSVDAVDGWRGCGLAIEEAERVPLSGDRFYHDELKGMAVVTELGVFVGIVRDVWSTGPYDLLVLDSGGTERLFPMVRELVVQIDRQSRLVTVRPPNGWLDDAAL
jgi:16S rRNA processing protein RimM